MLHGDSIGGVTAVVKPARRSSTQPKTSTSWIALKLCLILCVNLVCSACTGIPDQVTAVRDFELSRYLGHWYEIARFDHSFERGLEQVTAQYSLREDGSVEVRNRGYDPAARQWEEATGTAKLLAQPNIGRLKVAFFWPFYASYNIIALDPAYQYALVCGPTKSYLWILARSPQMDPAIVQDLVAQAQALGFATDQLLFVHQPDPDDKS